MSFHITNTELTRSLIVDDHLETSSSPAKEAMYFYCDYADPLALQPVNVYRALLQQLFFKGLMPEATINCIIELLKKDVHGLGEQKLTDLICAAVQSCAVLHVFMDGLDECDRDAQDAITKTLYRLLGIGHPIVKIFVTCRDEGYLLTALGDFDRLHISTRASAADIQSYVSHAIASCISSGSMTLRNPALKEEIVSKLVEKAQGMYVLHNGCRLLECRILRLSGFSGCTFRLLIYATQPLTKRYARSSSIYRTGCTIRIRGSSRE